MRTITPRRWPLGLFLLACLGLLAMLIPGPAGATSDEPCPSSDGWSKVDDAPGAVVGLPAGVSLTWSSTVVSYDAGPGELDLCVKSGEDVSFVPPPDDSHARRGTWFDLTGAGTITVSKDISHVSYRYTPPESAPGVVVITKAWIGDADVDPDVSVMATSFAEGAPPGAAHVDQVVCGIDASGQLVEQGTSAPCSLEVPANGTYSVSESVSGWSAVSGVGSEFVPGQGPTCPVDGLVPACGRCEPVVHEHCITNEHRPSTTWVELDKAWVVDDGGTIPEPPDGAVLTVQAYDAEGAPWGDPVECSVDAGHQFVGPGGGPCRAEVPMGGTYSVTEDVPPGFAASGTGTGFVPGEQGFCDDGDVAPAAVARFGHCVTNDDVPEEQARLLLTKDVRGGPDDLGEVEFTFVVRCGDDDVEVTLGVDEPGDPIGPYPVGTECEIVETAMPDPPDGHEWADVEALSVTLSADGDHGVTFTNELTEVRRQVVTTTTGSTTTQATVLAATTEALETLPRTGARADVAVTALALLLVGAGLVLLVRRQRFAS